MTRLSNYVGFFYCKIYVFFCEQAPLCSQITSYRNIWIYIVLFSFSKTDPNEKRDEDTGPKLNDLGFWDKLVALVASVIEEDRNSYAPVLSQFPAELNIGQVKNTNTQRMFFST